MTLNHNLIELTKEQERKVFGTAVEIATEILQPELKEFDKSYILDQVLLAGYKASRILNANYSEDDAILAESVSKTLEEEHYDGKNVLGIATAIVQVAAKAELNMLPENQTKEGNVAWLAQSVKREKVKQSNNAFQATKTVYRSVFDQQGYTAVATASHVKPE